MKRTPPWSSDGPQGLTSDAPSETPKDAFLESETEAKLAGCEVVAIPQRDSPAPAQDSEESTGQNSKHAVRVLAAIQAWECHFGMIWLLLWLTVLTWPP